MAVRKVQGWEDSTAADAAGTWGSTRHAYNTTTVHKTVSGYGSAQSIKIDQQDYYQLVSSASGAGDKLHVAMYVASGGNTFTAYIQLLDVTGAVQAAVDLRGTDGLTRIRRGAAATGTVLATSAATVSADAWHTFKIIATCREAASGGRIQVFLDGSATAHVDTGASVDCRQSATDDFRQVRVGTSAGNTINGCFFDCFYWVDSTETVPDEPLYIVGLRPDGDGATVQSTPSTGSLRYATVDENPISTTDYNEIGTAGNEDQLDMGGLSGSPSTILCVAPVAYATGDGTLTQLRTLVSSNGTTTYGTNQTTPTGGTYGVVTDFYTVDPSGGGAWTAARVNAMLCGYEAN